jgi:hypothetical protein
MDFMGSIGGMSQYRDYLKYVEAIDFPASKQDIIDHLQENNAPDQMVSIAEKIPDKVYASLGDVIAEVQNRI